MKLENESIPIKKIFLEIYPELVSSTNIQKQLNNYAIWTVAKAIDRHKQGSGKFLMSSMLYLITQILKVNQKYAYTIFKNGADLFWSKPSSNKEVYLFSIDKIVKNFPVELAKTAPFKCRVNDLYQLETSGEVRSFMCGMVISRYGQKKPISKESLGNNLGCSKSTVKRHIKNSSHITIKNNYEFIAEFDHVNFAHEYKNKYKLLHPELKDHLKIIKKDKKYILIRQLANSYSMEDYSRIKLGKRPKALKIVDYDNNQGFEKRKYYIGKSIVNKQGTLSKKETTSDFCIWDKPNQKEEIPSKLIPGQNKTRIRSDAKFWLNKEIKQE